MGAISEIVTINITSAGVAIKEAGFGIPMIADYHTRNADLIRFYSSLQGLLDDGFVTTDAAYLAAAAVFAQTPQVPLIALGRRALSPTIAVEITPVAANSTIYNFDVSGPAGTGTASFTSDATATVAEICTGITSAINTLALGVTATDATTKVTLAPTVAGKWFSIKPYSLSLSAVAQTHADPGIAADLAAIQLVDNTWYGVTLTTMGKSENIAAAAWVESNKKLGFFPSQDSVILTNTAGNYGLTLKTANYTRSHAGFHESGSAFIGAALMGATFPYDPGSINFEFRNLAGVSKSQLTATHIVNLKANNVGYFADYGGIGVYRDAKTAAGTFIDLIRDRDWLQARMETRLFSVLAATLKVPYTDRGIAALEAEVRAQLTEGIAAGYLSDSPAPVVTAPKASEVNPTDKANRLLNAISFSATIAGAIDQITVNGTVSI
jgi:hypothetical protein